MYNTALAHGTVAGRTAEDKHFRAKALVNLGVTAFDAGDQKAATDMFIKAATEDPTHETALQNLRALGVPGY